ncbi:hypothetical protein BKA62DRAFT_698586 [Auriculariales sp. MPI-PUGE-AT-0066]|nr:hypothetical protein BKA62DRAFT_698586 [Auriculariales sp. MPI-PUGE-AT-0066]
MSPPRVINSFFRHPSKLLHAAHIAGLIEHVIPPTPNMSSAEGAAWFAAELPGASAAVVWPLQIPRFGARELDIAGPQFRAVATYSVGHEHIDVEECRRRAVKVSTTPHISDDAVANMTLLLLLMVMRRATEHLDLVRAGGWPSYQTNIASNPLFLTGQSVRGRTVGFYGMGRIAQKVVERLLPMGPDRILYTVSQPRSFSAQTFPRLHALVKTAYPDVRVQNEPDLLRLAEECDILICLTALVPATRHSIGKQVFSRMKRHGILVNVSRGAVVDTEALVGALQSDQIFGAALDVLEGEPNIAMDHSLLDESLRNRVVVFPHSSSAEEETRIEMAEVNARSILLALDISLEACGDTISPYGNLPAYL